MNRLAALESLRGLLALWVLVGHVLGVAYADAQVTGVHLGLLYQPVLGLRLFIILSGFVIFYLLDHSDLPYGAFVGRRFMRLAPVYFLVLTVSTLMLPVQLHALRALPWQDQGILTKIATKQESIRHLWPHFIVHLSLLQGLVPNTILRFSDYAILGPAWSISLEWQFYLLAPVLFQMIRAGRWMALSVTACAFIGLRHLNYPAEGFIGNQFGYFLIGIVSYYVFKLGRRMGPVPAQAADMAAIAGAAMAYFFFRIPWHFAVWAIVLATITFRRSDERGLTGAVDWTLSRPALKWLGQVSYSVYLWHMPVLYVVMGRIEANVPGLTRGAFLAMALPGTVMVTLGLSALTYRFVELPGIRFGKTLGGRKSEQPVAGIAAPP